MAIIKKLMCATMVALLVLSVLIALLGVVCLFMSDITGAVICAACALIVYWMHRGIIVLGEVLI